MAKVVKKPRKKNANGYRMPEPIPKGTILTDILKKQWKIGPSIGKGGFGEIYSAKEASQTGAKYPYVIKIEPHENGPLFVEMHFYMRCGKQADIDEFKSVHKLKTFGMPTFYGSGSHEMNDIKYRFVVMERFGSDIDKLRLENGGKMSPTTAFQLAWQITYVLEYIHQNDYIHADIKGANILLGTTKETKNQCYLVDFGLTSKFSATAAYKKNPKKAHDGTIEYLSRDAHDGVPTRRGDFEVLGYNLVEWLGGKLPWKNHLGNPLFVQDSKIEAMEEPTDFLKTAFEGAKVPAGLAAFFNLVISLDYNSVPEYSKIRSVFEKEIKAGGGKVGVVSFEPDESRKRKSPKKPDEATPGKKVKDDQGRARGRKVAVEEDGDNVEEASASEVEKKASRPKKKPVKKGRLEQEANVEEDSENESETPKEVKTATAKGRARKKEEAAEEHQEIETAEMKRIREKMRNGKANKVKKTIKENGEKIVAVSIENDGIKEVKQKMIAKTKKIQVNENVKENVVENDGIKEVKQKIAIKAKKIENGVKEMVTTRSKRNVLAQ